MNSAVARGGKGLWEGLYRVLMRRNSVYVTFVIAGAFAGERAVDYGVHRLWEYNNVGGSNSVALRSVVDCGNAILFIALSCISLLIGYWETWSQAERKLGVLEESWERPKKRYEDISVLGQRPAE